MAAFPVTALVLAAGLSRRMGSFKMLLPWQGGTVIGQVVTTLAEAGVADILVVTGHRAGDVSGALAGSPARTVFNAAYAEGEMLSSIQVGLAALGDNGRIGPASALAVLLCLGDQPQMEGETVRAILDAGEAAGWTKVVIPSYRMRAGHPILLPRALWAEILAGPAPLNAVLGTHRDRTVYVKVNTPAVLADLDTPEDYTRQHGVSR